MTENRIEEVEIFIEGMEIAEKIWNHVNNWGHFANRTLGYQLVKSADSIAANISEGYGRYFFKENRQFCYIARGSLFETKTFLIKAKNRDLLTLHEFDKINQDIEILLNKLNVYIKQIEIQISSL